MLVCFVFVSESAACSQRCTQCAPQTVHPGAAQTRLPACGVSSILLARATRRCRAQFNSQAVALNWLRRAFGEWCELGKLVGSLSDARKAFASGWERVGPWTRKVALFGGVGVVVRAATVNCNRTGLSLARLTSFYYRRFNVMRAWRIFF